MLFVRYVVTRDVPAAEPGNGAGRALRRGEVLYAQRQAAARQAEPGISVCERPGGDWFTAPRQAVKKRREKSTEDVLEAVARLHDAAGERARAEDAWALGELMDMRHQIEDQAVATVARLRKRGTSWADIAAAVRTRSGKRMTKSGAFNMWARKIGEHGEGES